MPEHVLTSALALLAVVYFVVATMIMRKSQIMHFRHYLFLLPAVFLLFGLAIGRIGQQARWLAWGLLLAAVAAQWPLMQSFRATHKTNHRLAAAIAVEHLHEGDLVLTSYMHNPAGYRYYLERRAGKSLMRYTYGNPAEVGAACAVIHDYPRFAFVRHAAFEDLTQALRNTCGQGYRIRNHDADGMRVEMWEREATRP